MVWAMKIGNFELTEQETKDWLSIIEFSKILEGQIGQHGGTFKIAAMRDLREEIITLLEIARKKNKSE